MAALTEGVVGDWMERRERSRAGSCRIRKVSSGVVLCDGGV